MNNRPIKFRVWSTEYKQWMNHCSVIDSEGNILILYYELKQDRMLHPIVSEYSPDSVTIQQFTGLTDSTGKEIYEGDFLVSEDCGEIDAVYFEHGCFWVDNQWLYDHNQLARVVGNIFETPELLT